MSVEVVVFAVFAAAAIAGAITMVGARNPVYSAMGLLMTMFSVAVFYVLNDAHFLAAVQILIYAGAVMTLFLFVIMLIGVDRSLDETETLPLQRPIVVVLGVGLFALLVIAGRGAWVTGSQFMASPEVNGTIENVSEQLFGTWMLPFLSTMLLLTIAAVGTIALAQFTASPRSFETNVAGMPPGEGTPPGENEAEAPVGEHVASGADTDGGGAP